MLKKIQNHLYIITLIVLVFAGSPVFSTNAQAFNDGKFYIQDLLFPNDPGFDPNPANIDRQWYLLKAKFPDVWQANSGSRKVLVAIIDTGIDQTHEDLKTINFLPGYDFVNGKKIEPGTNSDDNGHGTMVTGVLGATANNNIGIAGTNWQISVLPVKALDSAGAGTVSQIIESIKWAADNGVKIINLSLGGTGFGRDTALADAVSYAYKKNVLIVAAAGNDSSSYGRNLDQQPIYPICDDGTQNMVLGVTALDEKDQKPAFANFGKNCIDVSAPGKRMLSSINFDPLTRVKASNSYAYGTGTSLAAPLVSGEAALLFSLYPQATNAQIRDKIIETADPVDYLNLTNCLGQNCNGLLGKGRINAQKALSSDFSIGVNAKEGELVQSEKGGQVYEYLGGEKRPVSLWVMADKFAKTEIKILPQYQIDRLSTGYFSMPKEGTLVKQFGDNSVFVISKGKKRPVLLSVFKSRKYNFSQVKQVSFEEMDSWPTGDFWPLEEGVVVRAQNSKTLFWVVNEVLHPINAGFYQDKGLKAFKITNVSASDLEALPKGEPYLK